MNEEIIKEQSCALLGKPASLSKEKGTKGINEVAFDLSKVTKNHQKKNSEATLCKE